ncbi:MAG: hypothetical protein QOD42_688 [Sphingomonadales bacterium]|jgi:hypothetical protein|nr:hypothetical protein [Sphingomonadales bacterium]
MRRLAAFCLCLAPLPAAAQTIATSARPDRVGVTVYRNPQRPPDQRPDLQWLNGFALISETRQVTLPAGETELRFEGVAGGILPQSAIVTGLPEGTVERNRDAYLLSPATLLDRSLGRRVHLRRTSRATGRVREQDAIVRTGAGGAVIVQTEGGFESLRCTGLPETLLHDGVPQGLSARPTLSVRARSGRAVEATVTLSYLASGFDWQADYVATLSEDGSRIDLFAWLTLASTDETSFVDADTQAVAGRLNRQDVRAQPSEGGPLTLACWPQATTSDIPLEEYERMEPPEEDMELSGVVNFDRRAMPVMAPMEAPSPPPPVLQAQQEELGDLKLYRIPEPVTVAANSQKQVALLRRPGVAVRTLYRTRFYGNARPYDGPAQRLLVTRNRTEEGLGLPLPAGRLMLFDSRAGTPFLVGEAVIRDHAVGEDVEIGLGAAPGVRFAQTPLARTAAAADYEIVVTNDGPAPVAFEAEIAPQESRLSAQVPLSTRNGMSLWQVTVPANGSATLRYRLSR